MRFGRRAAIQSALLHPRDVFAASTTFAAASPGSEGNLVGFDTGCTKHYIDRVTTGIKTSDQFFLWDYEGTLFPLRTNRLLVERYAAGLRDFIQNEVLDAELGFQSQHRVFASKRGWFLRPTVKLDPVAEFFLYDFVYRKRRLFRKSPLETRRSHGFRIVNGEPIPILKSYTTFKKTVAKLRAEHNSYAYLDIAAYFNHIYQHDLVRWFEEAGADPDDVVLFGQFLREIVAGRSVDCLPQGLYPAKMIGAAFLGFLEGSNRVRAAQTVRLMDDMWLFDNDQKRLVSDFLMLQSLLSQRGLTINDKKSAILEGHDPETDLPPNLDEMKIQLLRKRRSELAHLETYGDPSEDYSENTENGEDLGELEDDEKEYLSALLKQDDIQEEDAELVLTLMRDHTTDVMEFLPTLISEFPGLAKRLYYFCAEAEDKPEVAEAIRNYLDEGAQVTEYQLFWFGKMIEDYLLQTPDVGKLLIALYEHENATDISKAKILEIPEKRFGLPDLREEQLRTGHSDWLAWTSAVGSRNQPKGQRNHLLKYFRKASPLNRLIGEFVESAY